MDDPGFTRVDRESGRILVVEPDPLMLTAISACLDQQGHRVTMAKSEAIAKESIQNGDFDLLILSIADLEEGCGLAGRLRAFEATLSLPVIFMMEELSKANHHRLAEHGGVYCLQIPFQPETLLELTERALWLPHVARSRLRSKQPEEMGDEPKSYRDWVSL